MNLPDGTSPPVVQAAVVPLDEQAVHGHSAVNDSLSALRASPLSEPCAIEQGARPVRLLLGEAHAQIRHLIDDLTDAVDDDGLTRYVPRQNLTFSNCIAALIPLADRIDAALAASPPAAPADLHAAILNLPCDDQHYTHEEAVGYRMGHRDARHAAAQLVSAAAAQGSEAADPDCTCGSDSPRAFNHASSCPHSTPWKDRVKARIAAPATPVSAAIAAPADLHAAIMNLPCPSVTEDHSKKEREMYERGHRAARHAAAELVSPAAAKVSEPDDACDGPICHGWQVSVANGHSGWGVYAHMSVYPEEGAMFLCAIPDAAKVSEAVDEPHHVHEAWWLVESTFAPRALYYAGHRRDGKAPVMVDDASKAVRFPTEDAALFTITHALGLKAVGGGFTLAHMGYVVREHIFDYTAPASQVSAPPAAPAGAAPRVDELMELARQYAHAYFNHHGGWASLQQLTRHEEKLRTALCHPAAGDSTVPTAVPLQSPCALDRSELPVRPLP